MDKHSLRNVIIDQREIQSPSKIIPRTIYKNLVSLTASKEILILSGIRRCGKSTLLRRLRDESMEKDYCINFDDDRLVHFKLEDFQTLYELFVEMYGPQKTFYFDEIQNIDHWERFVRRLHDQGNKVLITGSNASMLSAELGTKLTGRHIEINIYPYSFSEYLDYTDQAELKTHQLSTVQRGMLKAAFNDYFKEGGLPEYLESRQIEYLHSLYQNILYRDIIVRHQIKNYQAMKELVYYLASNLGKECSFNAMKKMLGLSSATTVSDYCAYLQDSFLCFFISRYDFSLKKQIQHAKKVYFIDQALAVAVGFRFSQDEGRLLENIVFLELKRRGHEIYFHKEKKECDFILREGANVCAAIQVTLDLDNPATRERELAGLLEAMQRYQLTTGIIITNDTFAEQTITVGEQIYQVQIIPVWSWLLETSDVKKPEIRRHRVYPDGL